MTKKELRLVIKEKLSLLDDAYLEEAGRKIEKKVINSSYFKSSKNIFVYISVQNEPPTDGIIREALTQSKNVFVPKCLGKGIMKAVRIESTDDLVPGYMSIPEPKDDTKTHSEEEIDLAIVPCVTATNNLERLGHGGGYYDRFLENRDAFRLCLCYEKIIQSEIPTDSHDLMMDFVLTEESEI